MVGLGTPCESALCMIVPMIIKHLSSNRLSHCEIYFQQYELVEEGVHPSILVRQGCWC